MSRFGRDIPFVRWTAFAICAVACCTACGVSVSVHAGTISDAGAYQKSWKESWQQIKQDDVAYLATAQSPGACNRGSTKTACVLADRTVDADVQALAVQLGQVHVPGAWNKGTRLMLAALTEWQRGLTLRMRSLSAGSWTMAQRNIWFAQGQADLKTAAQVLQRAWSAYPDWSKPMLTTPV